LKFYKLLLQDRLGYAVIAVSKFYSAIDVFKNNEDIGLVITDYTLSYTNEKLNGCSLIQKLLSIRDVPHILSSGTNVDDLYKCERHKNGDILEKPFNVSEVREKIEKVYSKNEI